MWNHVRTIIKSQEGFTNLYTVLIGISVIIAVVGGLIVDSILLPTVKNTHTQTINAIEDIISSGY